MKNFIINCGLEGKSFESRLPLTLFKSTDNGETWIDATVLVSGAGKEYPYPCIIADGRYLQSSVRKQGYLESSFTLSVILQYHIQIKAQPRRAEGHTGRYRPRRDRYDNKRVCAHILDEDRKVNAQKFESAFYTRNTDLRDVRPPADPQETAPASLDLAGLVEQLQKSPELQVRWRR